MNFTRKPHYIELNRKLINLSNLKDEIIRQESFPNMYCDLKYDMFYGYSINDILLKHGDIIIIKNNKCIREYTVKLKIIKQQGPNILVTHIDNFELIGNELAMFIQSTWGIND